MITSQLNYFQYFKKFIGLHVYGYILVNFFVGLLDGLGLAMFIPLLSIASKSETTSDQPLGNLQFILHFFKHLGLEINLLNALILMVSLFIAKGIVFYIRIIYYTRIRQVIIRKIRFSLVEGLQKLSYEAYTHMDAGKIQNNMVGETNRYINALTQYFNLIQHFIMLSTYVFLAYLSNWKFAILVAIGGIISNFFFRYLNKITKEYASKQTHVMI